MKKKSLFVLLFLFAVSSYSQNLIVNSDFEDINICQEYQEACSPKGWRPSGLKQFTYAKRETGHRYIRLLLFDLGRKNDRKFAQTELLYPLEEGRKYTIKFKVKPKQFWIKEIGVAFSDTLIISKEVDLKDLPASHLSLAIPEEVEEEKWYSIEKDFIAEKGQRFLIIGNFLEDEQSLSKPIDKKKYKKHLKQYLPKKRIEYGIDEVQLFGVDTTFSYADADLRKAIIYADSTRHSLHRTTRVLEKESIETPPVPATDTVATEQEKTSPREIPEKIIFNVLAFEHDQSTLLEKEYPKLNQVIDLMEANATLKIKITGHTDSMGAADYNLRLSQRRADAIGAYLNVKGIPKDHMLMEGKGEMVPLGDNETSAGRQENRRVEIEFYQVPK